MDRTQAQKVLTKVSAKLEQRNSPVRKDQDAVPIADAMRAYHERGMLSFGIPAHSGGRGPKPEFTQWLGDGAARFDLPMSHGVDTRDHVWAVQQTAQELFAEAVGAKETLFSTNGSSLSVRVALMAVAGPGETVIMARNPHKSSVAGLIMNGSLPVWIDPVYDDELEIAHVPTARTVTEALDAHPHAKAVVIFTPSYYGTAADVRAIAEACHARDVPLVTDDARGLDYARSGHPELPEGALAQRRRPGDRQRPQDDHRPGTDLGAVRRHRPHRQRAPAAVLRAREVHERVDRAALEHRRRAAPVRPRRPRAARPGDR